MPEKAPKIRWQDPRYRCSEEGGDAKRTYSIGACTTSMDWPCHNNAWWASTRESILWRTSGGKALPRWPEETIQRHPKSLPKIFQHTTDGNGSSKTALPHQKGNRWFCSKENPRSRKKAQRAKSQSQEIIIRVVILSKLTCSICNRQFKANLGSNQPSKNKPWV